MKKVLLIFVALTVLTLSVTAQGFKKSDKIIEGMAKYNKEDGNSGYYSVSPTVGYFINDKIALGLNGEFSTSDGKERKVSNIGAFGRLYFLEIGKEGKLKVFTQLSVLSSKKTISDSITVDGERVETITKTSGVGFNWGVGANYFITSRLALSTNLFDLMSYNSAKSEFMIGFNGVNNPLVTPSFGVLYKF